MYIKSKFLLTHAATGRRNSAAAAAPPAAPATAAGRAPAEAEAIAVAVAGAASLDEEQHLINARLQSAVRELSVGNYQRAMARINEAMVHSNHNHGEIMSLLELKNIVARLRLKCASPDQLFGPTHKSNALPYSFSVEMLDVVQKVLRCRNHYEVLRISHHATYSEVKRAYKRLALRLHPDKNRAPGAVVAFRRINEAADTLTDNQKRIEYNMLTAAGDYFGGKATLQADRESLHTDDSQQPRRGYEPANQRVPQRQSLYQTEQLVIGLVAALVFIIITVHYLANAPNYSFTPTSTHSVRLVSSFIQVPFFVTPQLAASQTAKELERMEQEIEEFYVNELKQNCKQERKLREKLLQRARHTSNLNLRDHAIKMPTPACHALLKLDQNKYRPLLLDNNSDFQEIWHEKST